MMSGKSNRRIGRRAFTLIELLLVLVILAVLAAVVVPNLTGRVEMARRNGTIAEISNLKTALQAFELDIGHFPSTNEGLEALVTNPGYDGWRKYIDEVPLDKWNHAYIYKGPDSAEDGEWDVISLGQSGQEGNSDNIDKYVHN